MLDRGSPLTCRTLSTQATMDLEVLGAAEAYQDLAVPLPLSFYAAVRKAAKRGDTVAGRAG